MRRPDTTVALLTAEAPATMSVASTRLARIVALRADGTPEVRFTEGRDGMAARVAFAADPGRLAHAVATSQQALVLFENGDPSKPIIVGLLEPEDAPPDSAGHTTASPAPFDVNAPATGAGSTPPVVEADVDGRRVRVTAQDEIVLQCGSASITLRRNGRVVIRGTYVETHSDGTNRIKGGQVQIN